MGALAVNQLLSSSQDKGVELTLETAPLENQVDVDKGCLSYCGSTGNGKLDSVHRR